MVLEKCTFEFGSTELELDEAFKSSALVKVPGRDGLWRIIRTEHTQEFSGAAVVAKYWAEREQ